MVATMRKFVFLAFHRDWDQFLHELRDLGMIHVVEQDRTEIDEENLETFIAQSKRFNEAAKKLNKQIDKKSKEPLNEADSDLGYKIPNMIEEIEDAISQINQKLQVAIKERDALKVWGDFNPENIKNLEKAGYRIQFFVSPNNLYDKEWETNHDIYVLKREASRIYFIALSRGENLAEIFDLEEEKIPDVSLSELNGLIDSLKHDIELQNYKLKELAKDLPSLELAIKELESEMTFTKVVQSGKPVADNKLILLQGWAPEDNVKEISEYLDTKSVYYETYEPVPEDDVPIKFKNNRFAKIFEPIAELYELPSYNEIDLTPYFAPFYMIFFGLSLGDIGYGAFLLLFATLVKIIKKDTIPKSMRGIMTLVQFLGGATMFCGLLQGGFFGFSIYEINSPIIQNLENIIYFDNSQMFMLSLVLGVIQIMFGMFIKIFNRAKQFGFAHSLSTIGWFVFLISFILSFLFPNFLPMGGMAHNIVMILSGILIVFFNSPGKNIFVNIGSSLWDTYNMATGLLGDVLSYVRLFALGLSGGILAGVFSSLSVGMSPDNAILGPLVTILIFVAGHAINMFMNALGAFVHPLRLTFVEFYNNSEFTGGGKKYNPFRKELNYQE